MYVAGQINPSVNLFQPRSVCSNLQSWTVQNGTIIPLPPQSNDEGAKEQEMCHFDIIEMGGGVVQMFHLFCPRLYSGFQRDKTNRTNN